MAADVTHTLTPTLSHRERELWDAFAPRLVLKVSVLPTEIAATIHRAVEIGTANSWTTDASIHAHGLGRVSWITHGQDDLLTDAIERLRESLAPRKVPPWC